LHIARLRTPDTRSKYAPESLAALLLELLPEPRLREALLSADRRDLQRHEPAQQVGPIRRNADPVDDHRALHLEGVLAVRGVELALGVPGTRHQRREKVR
jgi:hypothetical protein